MKTKIILLILTLFLTITTANAADFYVNPDTGDDTNTGTTPGDPFLTINRGVTSVTDPSDVVNLASGTYSDVGDYNIDVTQSMTVQGAGEGQTIIDPQSNGRVFNIGSGVNFLLAGVTIQNGKAPDGSESPGEPGGAILNQGNLTVTDSTFTSNRAGNGNAMTDSQIGGNGGAIYSTGTLTITGCTFNTNSAGNGNNAGFRAGTGGNGGAIFSLTNFTITDTVFNSNTAGNAGSTGQHGSPGGSGGAIYNLGVSTVTGSTFDHNAGGNGSNSGWESARGGYGGAIFSLNDLDITSSNFTANHVGSWGNGETTVNGADGGAIYTIGKLNITDCIFTGNLAGDGNSQIDFTGGDGGSGGAIYCLNILEVRDSTFQSNQAGNGGNNNNHYENGGNGGNGGAIYAGNLLLSSSTFTANLAGNGGNANAEDDVYAGNGGNGFTAGIAGSGGAIYIVGTLNITQSSFNSNLAGTGGSGPTAGSGGEGGAIYNIGLFEMEDTTFSSNRAGNGGENTGEGNGASGGSGGAIYLIGLLNSENTSFQSNQAGNGGNALGAGSPGSGGFGGAIFALGVLNLSQGNCTGNSAGTGSVPGFGGALYIYHQTDSPSTITGYNFLDNTSPRGGGAIANVGGTITVNYNRFRDNLAPQGSAVYIESEEITDLQYNWWGINNPFFTPLIQGPADYTPWLILSITANPTTISAGANSAITTDLYTDSDGGNHQAQSSLYPAYIPVTLTTDLGNIGSKTLLTNLFYGAAGGTLRGDEGAGLALVRSLVDYDTSVFTRVTITADPVNGATVNAATSTSNRKTVALQNTGAPLVGIIMALLLVTAGLLGTRKM